MTATNHALTGAVIGLTVANPWLAIPAALLSHFVLDTIPHFGFKGAKTDEELLTQTWFRYLLAVEAALCFVVVVALALLQPAHWFQACVTAFVAAYPDLYSAPRFLYQNGWVKKPPAWNWFRRFHHSIQTERVWGVWVEVVWFAPVLVLFLDRLA